MILNIGQILLDESEWLVINLFTVVFSLFMSGQCFAQFSGSLPPIVERKSSSTSNALIKQEQAQQDQTRREQAQREQAQREQEQREQAQMQQAQQEKAPRMHFVKLEHKSTGQVLSLHVSGISADDVVKKSIVVFYLENGYKLQYVF